jgi:hypothetical protein
MTLAERARMAAILVGVAVAMDATVAEAQSADAEALFREGRRLIKAGKLDAGCDKLEASEHIESSSGTLLNLGDCRDKLGMTASAWAAFRKAEAMAKRSGDPQRQSEAQRRAAQLESRLLMLVIQVDHRVAGLVVRRDDESIEPAAWNTPIPVDPGTYTIAAEAPGYLPWKASVPVDARLKRRVISVPLLERAPAPPPPAIEAPAGVAIDLRPAEAPVVVRRPVPTWSASRKVAVALVIAGAGAAGTGVYFGLRSRDLADQADARCPLPICSDAAALRLNDQARDAATRANILYAAGGGALAVAAVLWFAGKPDDPNETTVVPSVGASHAGVSLARRF